MNISVEMQPGYSQYSHRQHREYANRQLPVAATVQNPDDLAGVLLLLSRLPELEVLALNQCRFGAAEREQLKRLITLHSLQVFSGEFGDAEVACLAELPELHVLHLSKTLVTDEGLLRLPVFPKLYSLHVTNSRFTDRMIEWLERQPQLETVAVLQSKFTTAGANRIAALPALLDAQFEEERMPDRIPNPEINATFHLKKCDAEIVERIRKLGIVGNRLDFVRCGVGLNLSGDAITDDSLKALAPITDLIVDLHLAKTAVTAAGLVEVGRLPHLSVLGLHHNPNLTGTMLASHLSPLFVRTPPVGAVVISTTESSAEIRHRNRQQFGLRFLILDGVALEQADLAALKPAFFLVISNGQLTDDKLKGFLSSGAMSLFLNNEPITDAGLLNLAESKHLSLRLSGSKVTEAGVAALRKRNPNISVTLAPAQPEPLE